MALFRIGIIIFATLIATTNAQHCRPIRYMPIGDSITEIVCWRAYLWEKLQNTGYANVNFVGSGTGESPAGCNVPSYDKDSEGHSGYLATHIVALNLLPGWLRRNPADVVTIHLGSNDISHGYGAAVVLDAFTKIIEQLRAANPNMKIIVAQIIPIFLEALENVILELNSRIPLWAASLSTAQSPILVVDQHTDFKVGDVRDGVHPNEAGDRKMAAKWYPALVQAIHLVPPIPEQDSQQAPLSYEL